MSDHHLHLWTLIYAAAGIVPLIHGHAWLSIIALGAASLCQQSVAPKRQPPIKDRNRDRV